MTQGRRWLVEDRHGRPIYLAERQWEHMVERHPEMSEHEEDLIRTIRTGRRSQDSLVPNKYFYRLAVSHLPEGSTHIEAVVIFRFATDETGVTIPNNFVITAYPIFMRS